jgi:hypothetical protein
MSYQKIKKMDTVEEIKEELILSGYDISKGEGKDFLDILEKQRADKELYMLEDDYLEEDFLDLDKEQVIEEYKSVGYIIGGRLYITGLKSYLYQDQLWVNLNDVT